MFLWVENAMKLVNSCLVIIKMLKTKMAAKFLANTSLSNWCTFLINALNLLKHSVFDS